MKKLEADFRLIVALTGDPPADWARRDNGDLVYLNQSFQKFILTDADISRLTDKVLINKALAKRKNKTPARPELVEAEPIPETAAPAAEFNEMKEDE